jgi:hypothetical protein
LAAACFGCSGATTENEPGAEPEALGRVEQPILNGTSWAGWGDGRSVRISNAGVNGCTAVALRDNWLLTARHCVTDDGTAEGSLVTTPGNISVTRIGDTVLNPAPVAINLYSHYALKDIAMIRLDRNVGLDGQTANNRAFTEIYGGPREDFSSVFCSGYGRENYASQNACTTGGAGTQDAGEEFASLSATRSTIVFDQSTETRLTLTPNASNQIHGPGDSGSGCAVRKGTANSLADWKQVWVANVVSSSCTEVAANNWIHDNARGPDMVAFRSWVADILGRYEGGSFTSASGLCDETFVEEWSPSGNPASWNCLGSFRFDNSNAGVTVVAGELHWGPAVVRTERPVSNGIVRSQIWSDDDDTAGVIGRWRDASNYYAFVVNPQNSRAQIIKMMDGVASVVKHEPYFGFGLGMGWGNTWQKIELRMAGAHLIGMINDQVVVTAHDTDDPHTTGFSGVMHAHMDNVYFSAFSSTATFNTANTDETDRI